MSVVRDLGLPVKFIGVGEKIDDLRDFEPQMFVDALLGNDEETSVKMQARVNKMLNLEPMKALQSAMSDGETKRESGDRLRASFGQSQSQGEDSYGDRDSEEESEGGGSDNKPKRAKRPKPQSAKPKKSKK